MLKDIYIDNYRRFINSKIVFGETALIAGKNGAGKTTLVSLLAKIKRFIINTDSTGHIDGLVTFADLPHWRKSDRGRAETHFILTFSVSGTIYTYELKIQHNFLELKGRISHEKLSIASDVLYEYDSVKEKNTSYVTTDDGREFSYGVDWNHSGLLVASRVCSKIRNFIEAISNEFHIFILAPDSPARDKDSSQLDISGNNFSQWYSKMLQRDIEVANGVLNSYKDFLPNVGRAFISDKGEFTISEKAEGKQQFEIAFSELSTGQQKLCIYYAIFKMLPDASTLVLDEFENHLSPAELQPLYDLAQKEQDERDLQIILVSHHHKTLNWYHDSALVFSLSGLPAHSKIDRYDPDDSCLTL
ncbi:MAG: ATP-binding protein, partial [Candidatus Adiutrix sp.]|nr:ATP-binding protein [Candidatus Adiutrix sp.]